MKKTCLYSLLVLALNGCGSSEETLSFDLQGHRGCRGLMPENSIPGFIHAIDLGVNTLEMDLVVTGDNQLLVSHEPFMSSDICLDPSGAEIPDSVQKNYNIYQMTYSEIQQFDCGSKPHPRFPEQQNAQVHKPLLQDVIDTVERYAGTLERSIRYNIELKSNERGDGIYHPTPQEFSRLVFEQIDSSIGWERVAIQSFDFRVLQYFHQHYPEIKLSLLIENSLSPQENVDSLGFLPQIYSSHYLLLSPSRIDSLHKMGMQVIPWTVNESSLMDILVKWGVDGLITDYPNRY